MHTYALPDAAQPRAAYRHVGFDKERSLLSEGIFGVRNAITASESHREWQLRVLGIQRMSNRAQKVLQTFSVWNRKS